MGVHSAHIIDGEVEFAEGELLNFVADRRGDFNVLLGQTCVLCYSDG